MSLELIVKKVNSIVKGVKDYFVVAGRVEGMRDYALSHYLNNETKRKLFEGKSEEEMQKIYYGLESKIRDRLSYHQRHLDKLSLKTGKFAGLATLINDVYHFYAGTPFSDFGLVKYALVGAKAILELPVMYSYMKDTGDMYGAVEWLGTKTLSAVIPILGPALDLNVAQRVIKKRVIREGVTDFLKEHGLYREKEPLYKRIYNRVKEVAGDFKPAPAYQFA